MAQFAGQNTNAPKSNFWTGSKGGIQDVPLYNQQQSGAFSSILNQALQMLSGQGNNPAAQQAINQFNTQTVPGLSERFTAMGGGQRSSGFQGALGSAAGNLHQGLQAQQFQQALPLLQQGLTQQYSQINHPSQQGFLQSLAPMLAQLGIGGLTGGVGGAILGGSKGIGKGIATGLFGSMGGGGNQGSQGGQGGLADIIKLLMGGG
jgi:hypothetical protein